MAGGVGNNYVVAFAGAALLASAIGLPALACDLSQPESGTVSAVIDGETLQLTDGRTVRLIGAKAPMALLGWRGNDPWPLVDEAKAALESLASGKASSSDSADGVPTATVMRSPRSSWSAAARGSGSRRR